MVRLIELMRDPSLIDRMLSRMKKRTCPRCHQAIESNGYECDCYYEALGKLVERRPIISPGVKRG